MIVLIQCFLENTSLIFRPFPYEFYKRYTLLYLPTKYTNTISIPIYSWNLIQKLWICTNFDIEHQTKLEARYKRVVVQYNLWTSFYVQLATYEKHNIYNMNRSCNTESKYQSPKPKAQRLQMAQPKSLCRYLSPFWQLKHETYESTSCEGTCLDHQLRLCNRPTAFNIK